MHKKYLVFVGCLVGVASGAFNIILGSIAEQYPNYLPFFKDGRFLMLYAGIPFGIITAFFFKKFSLFQNHGYIFYFGHLLQ